MNDQEIDMPKKTTVQVDAITARELEQVICFEISGWSETMMRLAPNGADSARERDALNAHFETLCPLIRARDAAIEAAASGVLPRWVLDQFAPTLISEALAEVPEMGVPQGTLAYFADKFAAAVRAEQLLAA